MRMIEKCALILKVLVEFLIEPYSLKDNNK